jgi:diguanylate cyclase (GGDEF)-like protein/putative nucleotidyltransferase with HDIG domain
VYERRQQPERRGQPERRNIDVIPPTRAGLPRSAAFYLVFVAGVTIAAASPFSGALLSGVRMEDWLTFAVLLVAAAVVHVFPVYAVRNQMFHTSLLFLLAAALLLPPELLVLIGVLVSIPEWLRVRYPWYIQVFNICNYTLNMLAAWGTAELVTRAGPPVSGTDLSTAVGGIAACVSFVALNHVLLGVMLRLARGHSLRDTGLFSSESLSVDLVLAGLGVALATFWSSNPWLIPIALGPLLVVHRSLSVPRLQAEARVDPKTGLYNARHFATALADELSRAKRLSRPMSLMMADLDLLRDINNTYGHLAGDAVLTGIAEIFRSQLRHYDVAARFGGEEFCVLLPETPVEQALEIAERIRRNVAERSFDVETSSEAIRATLSIGVASFPKDAVDSNELIHQADLAVYRAKMQGRNRVLAATAEPLLAPAEARPRLATVAEAGEHVAPLPRAPQAKPKPEVERRARPRRTGAPGPRFLSPAARLSTLVLLVTASGAAAGAFGVYFGASMDTVGLLAVIALVGVSQALAIEVFDQGTLSISVVGALAGAALFGPRAALPLALMICVVDWSARRATARQVSYNAAVITLASLAAAAVFDAAPRHPAAFGVAAGAAYFVVNVGLVSLALALEGNERWVQLFRERFAWLVPSYLVYGFVAGVIAIAYDAAGLYAMAVFVVPLLLMRKTQEAYLAHTRAAAQKLRQAATTIQNQNVSLEEANRLLRERSTAAMESLSATVDARDSYTAGHSRRVQRLALAIGEELGLSQGELDLLGHAALFHDIGKLAVPDTILLKPASLTEDEWALMQRHADEGARIIDRLGFLDDAVPAIRHHHERWDGTGYPDGLRGEEIPLGARIIHVADAFDSMLTTRIYRAARPATDALEELRRATGSQFCPRCVSALERVLPLEGLDAAVADARHRLRVAS